MSITAAKFVPYEMKAILIRVASYRDQNIRGSLGHAGLSSDIVFSNFTQLIFSVERILDELRFPQPSMEARSFRKDGAAPNGIPPAGGEEPKAVATFKLNVLFRQNASWQGTLHWLDDKSEVSFRSVLELMRLLDSVLSPDRRPA